jgi:hypothetical protein
MWVIPGLDCMVWSNDAGTCGLGLKASGLAAVFQVHSMSRLSATVYIHGGSRAHCNVSCDFKVHFAGVCSSCDSWGISLGFRMVVQ